MNIIVEGPDNAGKSTVVQAIHEATNWPMRFSGGREKYPGEINARLKDFLDYSYHIFDRHPAISQEIYRQVHNGTAIEPPLLIDFYKQPNIIIYCRPCVEEGLQGQIIKEYDKPEHMEQIARAFEQLVRLYDKWAVVYAHVIRRKYDNLARTIAFIQGAIQAKGVFK